jgi:hypothetical protein
VGESSRGQTSSLARLDKVSGGTEDVGRRGSEAICAG